MVPLANDFNINGSWAAVYIYKQFQFDTNLQLASSSGYRYEVYLGGLIAVTVVPLCSLHVQVHHWEEAGNHYHSCNHTRALRNTHAVKQIGEPSHGC